MSKVFFDELEIPEPDFDLGAGSGSHAEQTARVMVAFEKVCLAERPDAVVVVGDINSTMACAITAKKLGIRVAHVEAGLRSGDMGMPEEINRIVTDSISDWLFVTESSEESSPMEALLRLAADRGLTAYDAAYLDCALPAASTATTAPTPASSLWRPTPATTSSTSAPGEDITIRELTEMVALTVGYTGEIRWDATKPDGTPPASSWMSRACLRSGGGTSTRCTKG